MHQTILKSWEDNFEVGQLTEIRFPAVSLTVLIRLVQRALTAMLNC